MQMSSWLSKPRGARVATWKGHLAALARKVLARSSATDSFDPHTAWAAVYLTRSMTRVTTQLGSWVGIIPFAPAERGESDLLHDQCLALSNQPEESSLLVDEMLNLWCDRHGTRQPAAARVLYLTASLTQHAPSKQSASTKLFLAKID